MVRNPQSVNAILKDQLYLGNLAAAQSVELRRKLGITHIVSVCPEYPSTGPNHLAIAVQDSEYENLLIHLPNACRFIQNALEHGGKVLVHCVMGISRSTTVVCAYLMKTRHMTPPAAILFVRRWRPCVHPNYGFLMQLHAFAECGYEPSPNNTAYITWKRSQSRKVTNFLKTLVDTTLVIPDQLYMSSEFPKNPEEAESLLLDLGITHFISISPAAVPSASLPVVRRHIKISDRPESFLLALPEVCEFIGQAVSCGGEVLVFCSVETRACIAVCAYLMAARHITPDAAYAVLHDALPLFSPTATFSRHLELFNACEYRPTTDHPLVKEQLHPRDSNKSQNKRSSSIVSRPIDTSASALSAVAASMLCDTGFDVAAFGDTLAKIQQRHHFA